MIDVDYAALAEQAARDHQSANERYSQAFRDSEYAAFQELVFTAAAAGVTTVNLEPSDQGEHMTITEYEGGDEDIEEALDQGAMDLADNMSAHWAILPGVTYEGSRRGGDTATIDIVLAARGLVDLDAEVTSSPSRPVSDDEEQRFTDWQSAVSDRDTLLGFRAWLTKVDADPTD